MAVLAGLRVVQIGPGLGAAVCGRLFADAGAVVTCIDAQDETRLRRHLDAGKAQVANEIARSEAIAGADLIVCEGGPRALASQDIKPASIRRINGSAVLVLISPYGQTGPQADDPATDLTLLFASGIARMLTGQVDDLSEAPIRPVGQQSAFIGGIAAACAGMHAIMSPTPGAVVDVSIQEALATIAITELARAGGGGSNWTRRRLSDGNGATVCILPARDGYAAISPRDDHQWEAWLAVMGSPEWGREPRFRTKRERVANWDPLYALMCRWSRQYDKQQIADMAQEAHVPSFPLREPREQLESDQLSHRGFWRPLALDGREFKLPSAPFGLHLRDTASLHPPGASAGPLPLAGVRVLDFSWVIAGPTATRYLAAMGAEVVKVEAPGRGDPGRASELHSVLGQAKRAIVLDLKKPEAIAIARALAAKSDVIVENFATGVMDRLGLGADELRSINPDLIYVSASGLGRSGPEARAVAYGTLLQCYAGFAGLNRHPEIAPRVGLAWLDPMCGLMLAFITAAALWRRRRSGDIARVDFSMLEALLWTMAEPLIATQSGAPPEPGGNDSPEFAPHGVYRCAGPLPNAPSPAVEGRVGAEDDWLSLAVTDDAQWRQLCAMVPGLAPLLNLGLADRRMHRQQIDEALSVWARSQQGAAAAAALREAGIAAAACASSSDLVASEHLRQRGFWDAHGSGVLPGLPWRSTIERTKRPAPGLGADTEAVLHEVLGLSDGKITALREAGALG